MKLRNKSGITLIALIVTIIVLIIIAGISIATLTADNGILRQTNAAKVSKIEGDAREQVKLAIAAMRLAVAEAHAKDNSYKANEHAKAIQDKLIEVLQADKKELTGNFSNGSAEATNGDTEITIEYVGEDYQNATNDTSAKITYTIGLSQKTVELKDEVNCTLKDSEGNEVNLDIGADKGSESEEDGSGLGGTEEPDTTTVTELATVASIGDYVNYDPTLEGNVTAENTTYTSMPGKTEEHGNGYTNDADGQTFSAQAYKNSGGKWRILDIDENGTITLISDLIYQDTTDDSGNKIIGTTGLYLNGGLGYIWAEEELHRIAAIYGHGKGADTSQTITYYYGGPNDQDGSIIELDENNDGVIENLAELQQGRKATISLNSGARALTVEDANKIYRKSLEYDTNYSSSTVKKDKYYYPTIYTDTGKSKEKLTMDYYNTAYSYNLPTISDDVTVKTQIQIFNSGNYWLASRCVETLTNQVDFRIRYISNGVKQIDRIFSGTANGFMSGLHKYAVRAVVNLELGIKTNDTEYNSETGWNLAD